MALLSKENNTLSLEDLAINTGDNWTDIVFKNERFYSHKTMRIYYTSYDVRRGEDTIHIGTSKSNIMALNPDFLPEDLELEHPYWYAHVIGIYHANVVYIGKGNSDYRPRRFDFLWVRWYHFNKSVPYGWRH